MNSSGPSQLLAEGCDRDWQLKSAFNTNATRYLVTVGMEHSGHHMWTAVFPHLVDAGALRPHSSAGLPVALKLRALCTRGASGGACIPNWQQRATQVANAFLTLPVPLRTPAPDHTRHTRLVALEPFCSYPCSRMVEYPDVVTLSRGADIAGVDLRLMVLTRPAHEIIYDTTSQRLDDLVDGCTRLVYQLSMLDTRFFFCFPYNLSALAGEIELGAAFLGCSPTALDTAIRRVFHPSDRSLGAWAMLDQAPTAIRRKHSVLRQCTRTLDHLCTQARSRHARDIANVGQVSAVT